VGLSPRERFEDLGDFQGAVYVESAEGMVGRMTLAQRERLVRLQSQKSFSLARGEEPELAEAAAAGEAEWCVAAARENRRLMRRALGLPHPQFQHQGAMNVLSLCSGIGGLDYGLKIAVPEAKVVAYVEREPACQEVLRARMADGVLDWAHVHDDVKSFDDKPCRGVVDLVAGGYPCQPFSHAGRRHGADDPRHLWPHIRRIVEEVRPEWCLFENVGGHLSLGAPDVVGDLVGIGYRVAVGFFPARELGAPHKRVRLFVLAHADALRRVPASDGDAEGPGGGRVGAMVRGGGAAVAGGEEALPTAPAVAAVEPFPLAPRDPAWQRELVRDPSLRPRDGQGKLSPDFVERLMGFPRGWTQGDSRDARLRALGNAVVPAAAALAWLELSAALSAS
jgi:DNA (cytosine-5)-methyltransferase 1